MPGDPEASHARIVDMVGIDVIGDIHGCADKAK
jgi:hypothetical protein